MATQKAAGMNPSSSYWQPGGFFQKNSPSFKSFAHHTGFLINIPYPDPVSTPFYFGQNPEWGRRSYAYSTLPELHTIGGIMPTTAGIPRVSPYSFAARANRTHSIIKV